MDNKYDNDFESNKNSKTKGFFSYVFDFNDQRKQELINLEKYNKDNITYLIIPYNHPTLEFPLNIHDRKDSIIEKLEDKYKVDIETSKNKYVLKIKSDDETLRTFGFKKEDKYFIKVIE